MINTVPAIYKKLIDKSIKIDNRFHERRIEYGR